MSKPVYHALLYDRPGYLARLDRALTFLDSTDYSLTELEPEMVPFCRNVVRMPDPFAPRILARMRGQHEHLTCCMGS